MLNPDTLVSSITGRSQSLWAEAYQSIGLASPITGRRLLVPGGAGSIGSAFIETIIPLKPAAIVVVDPDENALAHLVRNIRNRFLPREIPPIETLSIGIGTTLFDDWIQHQAPFDIVCSFAARKHVRTGRDVWSALTLLEVNVLAHARLFEQCGSAALFAVSTDKAAAPANLMGASKRLMEGFLFSESHPKRHRSSARFANVLFSAGSLTESWWIRYLHHQAFACPESIQRYVISREESAHLCLLALSLSESGILIPDFTPERDQVFLKDLLFRMLGALGIRPDVYVSETEALEAAFLRKENTPWPVLLTASDTPGEKDAEIFFGKEETLMDTGFTGTRAIISPNPLSSEDREGILFDIRSWLKKPPRSLSVIEERIKAWVPVYTPVDGSGSLDQKV